MSKLQIIVGATLTLPGPPTQWARHAPWTSFLRACSMRQFLANATHDRGRRSLAVELRDLGHTAR